MSYGRTLRDATVHLHRLLQLINKHKGSYKRSIYRMKGSINIKILRESMIF